MKKYLLIVLLLCCSPAAAGENEAYIPAYNELARMIIARFELVDEPINLPLKDPASTDSELNSVLQRHMDLLRALVHQLMRDHYVAPGPVDRNARRWDEAFPHSAAHIMGENIGKDGVFTAVPGTYTVSDQTHYANEMDDSIPLLWIHFQELHETIKRLRYTIPLGAWSAEGETNDREGQEVGLNDTFADAKTLALSKWSTRGPVSIDDTPRAFTFGKYSQSQGSWEEGYSATLAARYSYLRFDNLPAHEGEARFYSYADVLLDGEWSDCGATVARNRWLVWDSKNTGAKSSLVSDKLGSAEQPSPWCGEPDPNVGSQRSLGYTVAAGLVHVEWKGLRQEPIESPEVRDTVKDGIVDTGCGKCATGKCLPGIDKEFDEKFHEAHLEFPLGLSSGLTNGNIRVKAYIAERYVEGEPRQCFSLDTRVDRLIGHSNGEWTFAEVVRPSGVRVLFALTGTAATEPVSTGLGYALHQDASGYELRFPDQEMTVHRFNISGSLVQVRRTVKNRTLTLNGTPSSWPKLRVGRMDDGVVEYVETASLVAFCDALNNGLIIDVDYVDRKTGETLADLDLYPGSRILRERDANGHITDETRIYFTNGTQEVWHDVTTNGVVSAAKKTIRSTETGPGEEEHTILRTEILHPDTIHEERHVTSSIFRSFDWDNERVARVVGFGTPSAQTNHYHYYEDAAATNRYSRLRLVEYPDGSWTRYDDYDARGRRLVVTTPFNDAPPSVPTNECRTTRYTYIGDPALASLGFPADDTETGNDHRPRLIIETALGQEISRTYYAHLPTGHITKRCLVAGAAYTDPDTLVTTSSVYTDGTFAGRLKRIEHPDGRLSTYTYDYQASPERLTTTQRTGAHDGVAVTNGSETVRTIGPNHELLSAMTRDIASGIVLTHTAYARDAFGRTLAVSNLVTGATTHNTLGCCGVESATDEEGTVTTYTYGNLKQLDQTIRLGVTNLFVYDVQGNTTRRGVAADGQTHWTYSAFDAAGRTVAVTNPLNRVTRYAYERTPDGGQRVTTTFADGSTRIDTSHRDGSPQSIGGTGAHPRMFEYGVGPAGTYEIEYRGSDTNATEWIKTTTDRLGRVATVQYADGHTVSNRYDEFGRQVAMDDGVKAALTEYDDSGAPVRSAIDMDRSGGIDLAGSDRISETHTRVTTHEGHAVRETTTLVYPELGSPAQLQTRRSPVSIDGSNSWLIAFDRTNHTHTAYDRAAGTRTITATASDRTPVISVYKQGLLQSVTRKDSLAAAVASQAFTYDALGRIKTSTETAANGDPRTTSNQYDPLGQLTNATVIAGALQQTTSHTYDAMGRRTRTVLPDGGVVTYEYNTRGELIGQHGSRVYPTRYSYTDQGRLATLSTYRNGLTGSADVTSWIYHPQRGWLTAKIYPDGEGEEYEYTSAGQLERKTRARGVMIDYAYDSAGDLASVTYSDATPSVQYARDRLGRAIRITDAIGTRTNTYEELGRLVQTTQPQAPGAVLHYQHDLLARLTNTVLKISGVPVHSTAYTRDAAGRIGTVSGPGVTAQYQYGRDGVTVANLTFGSALTTRKTYDSLNRLTEIRSDMSDGSTRSFAYTYNQANQRTTATTEDGAAWHYEYDDLGQLTAAHRHFADGTPIVDQQHGYEYDTIGNRKTVRRGVGATAGESTYTANGLNQYTQRTIPGRIAVTGEADPAALVTVQNHPGPTNIASRHGAPVDSSQNVTEGPVGS